MDKKTFTDALAKFLKKNGVALDLAADLRDKTDGKTVVMIAAGSHLRFYLHQEPESCPFDKYRQMQAKGNSPSAGPPPGSTALKALAETFKTIEGLGFTYARDIQTWIKPEDEGGVRPDYLASHVDNLVIDLSANSEEVLKQAVTFMNHPEVRRGGSGTGTPGGNL